MLIPAELLQLRRQTYDAASKYYQAIGAFAEAGCKRQLNQDLQSLTEAIIRRIAAYEAALEAKLRYLLMAEPARWSDDEYNLTLRLLALLAREQQNWSEFVLINSDLQG